MPTEAIETVEAPVVEDRRAVLEAAFEEASTQPEVAEPVKPAETVEAVKPVDEPVVPTPAPPPEEETAQNVDKAPQSWRPAQKAKWAASIPTSARK